MSEGTRWMIAVVYGVGSTVQSVSSLSLFLLFVLTSRASETMRDPEPKGVIRGGG